MIVFSSVHKELQPLTWKRSSQEQVLGTQELLQETSQERDEHLGVVLQGT